MRSWFFKVLLLLLISAMMFPGCDRTADTPQSPWPDITRETKPWTRFWWMGSAVNESDISRLMEEYSRSGIGGLEITPIYGAKGYEEQYIEFLSPEWIDMLSYTIEEAQKNEIGVDINLGTGWPYGGPHIPPRFGAKRLVISSFPEEGPLYSPDNGINEKIELESGDSLLAVYAVSDDGKRVDLFDRVDSTGNIRWTPETSLWEVFAAYSENTGQVVKRAAPGGEGLTIDPFSHQALEAYLDRFDQAFGNQQLAVRSMFQDSYEVYEASFTPELFDEFRSRRGYDVRPYIKELSEREENETNIRIQADFRETISDLLLEEFVRPWDRWIDEKNSVSRLQAHGSPGNLLDLYAASGIPEGETFGSSRFQINGFRKYTDDTRNPEPDPVMVKFASSAGNVAGRNLVSAETFTWGGEHFKVTLSELKPELEQVFLSGANHIFYHGTAYSPQEAPWPGWLFYASVQFNPNNSFWPHLKGMSEYIKRCQSVLQAGSHDNELLVYWPVSDIWHRTGNPDMLLTVHNIEEWLYPTDFYKTVTELMEQGYSIDFVSGKQLKESTATTDGIITSEGYTPYRTLIVPRVGYMPVEDMKNIVRLADEGATVIFRELPADVAGFHNLEENRKELEVILQEVSLTGGEGSVTVTHQLREELENNGIYREELVDMGLKFIRRNHDDGKYYYIVNHTADDIDTLISLNCSDRSLVIMDPQTGSYGKPYYTANSEDKTSVRLQIASGESLFVKTSGEKNRRAPHIEYYDKGEPIDFDSVEWSLTFTGGGPKLPEGKVLDEPGPWTSLESLDVEYFSGSADYVSEIFMSDLEADDYMLSLGDVRESARVWINGNDAGIVWSNPFNIMIGKYLQEGKNTIRIEVTNLMANRIRSMDRNGEQWRTFNDINFVSLFYTPFDASDWDVIESGLKGPVKIIPMLSDAP